jgi:hypothetical protein
MDRKFSVLIAIVCFKQCILEQFIPICFTKTCSVFICLEHRLTTASILLLDGQL